MKSFIDYLIESVEKSKYTFVVKIAGDIPDHCEETMKQSLSKFDLMLLEKVRTTPIQQTLPDFPQMENAEVTVYNVEVAYPTTSLVLQSYIAEQTGLSLSNIKVRSSKEEDDVIENELRSTIDKKSKPLLLTDYDKVKTNPLHGEKAISSFLKSLQNKAALTQYKGVNDQILAKSLPKEKN
jgi:hypothetical protein